MLERDQRRLLACVPNIPALSRCCSVAGFFRAVGGEGGGSRSGQNRRSSPSCPSSPDCICATQPHVGVPGDGYHVRGTDTTGFIGAIVVCFIVVNYA